MPVVEKRRVTMTSTVLADRDVSPEVAAEGFLDAVVEATDYVPLDILKLYVADARARWDRVIVGTEHDAGPGGETYVED